MTLSSAADRRWQPARRYVVYRNTHGLASVSRSQHVASHHNGSMRTESHPSLAELIAQAKALRDSQSAPEVPLRLPGDRFLLLESLDRIARQERDRRDEIDS